MCSCVVAVRLALGNMKVLRVIVIMSLWLGVFYLEWLHVLLQDQRQLATA